MRVRGGAEKGRQIHRDACCWQQWYRAWSVRERLRWRWRINSICFLAAGLHGRVASLSTLLGQRFKVSDSLLQLIDMSTRCRPSHVSGGRVSLYGDYKPPAIERGIEKALLTCSPTRRTRLSRSKGLRIALEETSSAATEAMRQDETGMLP